MKPLRVTNEAASHIFVECFLQYEVLVEADPRILAEDPLLNNFVIDFDIVAARVLSPVELKLFKLRVKYRKRPSECIEDLQLSSRDSYRHMKDRIRIKLGRGFVKYRLWPLQKYFNENHEKRVRF